MLSWSDKALKIANQANCKILWLLKIQIFEASAKIWAILKSYEDVLNAENRWVHLWRLA